VFSIENVLDDIELCLNGWRGNRCAVTFESSEDFISFVVATFPNEKSWRIRKEGTQTPDENGEN
jgi:hypothetical protein